MDRLRAFLLCGLLLAACGKSPAPAAPEPEEWIRPYAGHLPADEPHPTAAFLVVDARTGHPIEGARIRHHYELVVGPEGWAPLVQEARTDRFGLATLKVPPEDWTDTVPPDGHWVVQADGYAVVEEYGNAPAERIELVPGRTRHGRIVDALGRPLAGIHVGYKEGCAHAPFLAAATTDADGRFVVEGVIGGGELYYVGRGVLADYFHGPLRALDETPHTRVAAPSRRIRGRVTGFPIEALRPAMVVLASASRGAFAPVAADGTFVIDGGHVDGLLTLWYGPDGNTRELSLGDVRPGGPFVWDLSLGDRDPTESDAVATRELLVRVVGPDGRSVDAQTVAAYRVADGRLQDFAELDEDVEPGDPYLLHLLPGAYDIVVGEDGQRWHAAPVRIEIGKDAPAPLTIQAWEQARLEVAIQGLTAKQAGGWRVAYARPDGVIDHAELETWRDEPVWIPRQGQARVAIEVDGATRVFDVGPDVEGVRTARIDWPSPRRIRFTAESEPGYVHLGGLYHDVTETADGFEIETHLEGRLHLVAWPSRAREPGRRTEAVLVDLTGPRDAPIELGLLPWRPEAPGRVTVLDADGVPIANADVTASAADMLGTAHPVDTEQVETDERGTAESWLLREGAWIQVHTPAGLRWHHRVLEGEGPWTVRLGSCALEVELVGPYGTLLDGSMVMDGMPRARDATEEEEPRPARFTVHGLEPGPHELVVTAPDHHGKACRVVLKAGETRTLRLELEPRR